MALGAPGIQRDGTRVGQEASSDIKNQDGVTLARSAIAVHLMTAVVGLVVAAAFALGAMVAVAHIARPEPGPCRDVFTIPVNSSATCAAPQASSTLVLGVGTTAGIVAGAGVVIVRQRLRRARRD